MLLMMVRSHFTQTILFAGLKGMAEYCVLFVSSLHSQTPCKRKVFPFKVAMMVRQVSS